MSNLASIQTRSQPLGLTPQTISEAIELANLMSKSGIVPKDYQNNPGNIIVAIQWGAEIGLPPLQAMQNLAVINGRPALWGDAVIALVRGSGLLESIQEDIGDASASCTVKRRGEAAVTRTFSMEDAKRAGLAGKQGPWAQYPARMMQMRARAWALRDVFPDVLRGVHVAEEAQDMLEERPMGAAVVVEEAPRPSPLKEKLAAAREQVTLDQVLDLIANADCQEALDATKPFIKQLKNKADRDQAIQAGQTRKTELEAPALDAILKGVEGASSQEELDEWRDLANGKSPEEQAQVDAAIAKRLAEL